MHIRISILWIIVILTATGNAQTSKALFSKQTDKWIAQQMERSRAGDKDATEKLCDFYSTFKGYELEAFEYAIAGDKLGSVKCSFLLGDLYAYENGTKRRNADSAIFFYRKAANGGYGRAMYRTAQRLENTVPPSKNGVMSEKEKSIYTESASWYDKAAKKGIPGAANRFQELNLALTGALTNAIHAYEKGNYAEAFLNFKAGSDVMEDNDCKYGLASMYYEGLGTEIDWTAAQRLYSVVGNKGNANASYWAGVLTWKIAGDSKEAYKWLDLAKKQGSPKAEDYIQFITQTINKNNEARAAENKKWWDEYNAKQTKEANEIHPITNIRIPQPTSTYGTTKSYNQIMQEHESTLRAASDKTFERSQKSYYK